MAWTDQCKFEAVNQIENRIETAGGLRKALKLVSQESDIPYGTLKRWYYPVNSEEKSVPKNGNTDPTPEKFWKSIGRRLDKIQKDISSNNYQIPDEIVSKGENLCRLIGIKF